MNTTFQLAQAWLEHCRNQAEFFDSEAEDEIAKMWHDRANEAEAVLKREVDTDISGVLVHALQDVEAAIGMLREPQVIGDYNPLLAAEQKLVFLKRRLHDVIDGTA